MYAVIETGGKQYKVAIGDKLKVEKLDFAEGETVNLDRVLMVADGENVTLGCPVVESAVTATVVSHGKARKIKVFKMKRRKNYRRTQGHRQQFTEIEIIGIGGTTASANPSSERKLEPVVENEHKEVKTDKALEERTTAVGITDSANDNLTQINGIGPKIEGKLLAIGITTFAQIAEFDQTRIDEVNEQLSFKGRIEREEWVKQAKELAN